MTQFRFSRSKIPGASSTVIFSANEHPSSKSMFISVTLKMATERESTTASFFLRGNARQFDYVLKLYPQVLKLKADEKKKPEELIKLDEWCVC